MGNPPFLGYSIQNESQKQDILSILVDEKGKPYKTAGKVDYVAAWYFKSATMMQENPYIKAALVSTNSITQGEQVAAIWKPLMNRYGVHIDFAWRTFIWDSEASQKAHVHCVIIGFSICVPVKQPRIFDGSNEIKVNHINGYLIDADDVFIESRNRPLSDVPEIVKGSSPVDGGNLIIEAEDYSAFVENEPDAKPYVKRFLGAREFLHNLPRYCLWLDGISPSVLAGLSLVKDRIRMTRDFRLSSTKEATRKYADFPMRFMEVRQPNSDYIIIPRHSSENREYVPMGYMDKDAICGDANILMPDASLFHFGILQSVVHMAWMRIVCGRIKSDYRYSNDIVYNNFPWPHPTDVQKDKIEQTAKSILDARALYPDSSLADLYDDLTMPVELRKAHRANDTAVMEAYGFRKDMTEPEIVAELFKMYQKLTTK